MKKILLYTLIVGGLLALSSSCKDFLDKEPSNAVSNDVALSTINDCKTALNGVYSAMRTAYMPQAIYYFDLASDNLVPMKNFTNTYMALLRFNWNSGTDYPLNVWDNRYTTIVRANNIINAIDNIDGDAAEKARIKSECLLARALAHHDLVRLFGPVYNPTTANSDLGVPYVFESNLDNKARNTVEEVYRYLITDIENAIPGLTGTDVGYFTKGAAYVLLSRVKLYMLDYSGTVAAANDFATATGSTFGLAASQKEFNEVWSKDTGKEIVFNITLAANEFTQGRAIGDYFINDSQGEPQPDVVPSKNGSTGIIDQYEADDYRLSAYFRDTTTKQYGIQTLVFKYPGNKTTFPSSTFRTNKAKVFRYAELLLNKAEALSNIAGQNGNALEALNTLRSKRNASEYPASLQGQSLKDAIYKERRIEFPMEGIYYHDIKRAGKGFERVAQLEAHPTSNPITVAPGDYHFVWPIPIEEIRANKLMVQNNGYAGN